MVRPLATSIEQLVKQCVSILQFRLPIKDDCLHWYICKCTLYSDRLQLLLDIYNDVNIACFAAAAKAVVSYMDHLKTLQDVEAIAKTNCPSGILFKPAYFKTKLLRKPLNVILPSILRNFVDYILPCNVVQTRLHVALCVHPFLDSLRPSHIGVLSKS